MVFLGNSLEDSAEIDAQFWGLRKIVIRNLPVFGGNCLMPG